MQGYSPNRGSYSTLLFIFASLVDVAFLLLNAQVVLIIVQTVLYINMLLYSDSMYGHLDSSIYIYGQLHYEYIVFYFSNTSITKNYLVLYIRTTTAVCLGRIYH